MADEGSVMKKGLWSISFKKKKKKKRDNITLTITWAKHTEKK